MIMFNRKLKKEIKDLKKANNQIKGILEKQQKVITENHIRRIKKYLGEEVEVCYWSNFLHNIEFTTTGRIISFTEEKKYMCLVFESRNVRNINKEDIISIKKIKKRICN